MRSWIRTSLVVLVTACAGLSLPAQAQPRGQQQPQKGQPHGRPDDKGNHDRHDDAKDRRDDAKDRRDDAKDRRDDAKDRRNDPKDPAIIVFRDRFVQRHDQERQQRKEARRDAKVWRDKREERARERRKEITTSWGNVLNRPEAKVELALHADRMARLDRLLDIADDKPDAATTARIKAVVQREMARHAFVLQGIKIKAGVQ